MSVLSSFCIYVEGHDQELGVYIYVEGHNQELTVLTSFVCADFILYVR